MDYEAQSFAIEEYGDVYQGIVTLHSSSQPVKQFLGTQYHYTIGDAQEEAAKIAYICLMRNLKGHTDVGGPDQTSFAESTSPLSGGTSCMSQASPFSSGLGYVQSSPLSASESILIVSTCDCLNRMSEHCSKLFKLFRGHDNGHIQHFHCRLFLPIPCQSCTFQSANTTWTSYGIQSYDV